MSLFDRRVPLGVLADFCDRFGVSLQAGVDPRRALESEVQRVGGPLRTALVTVCDELRSGASLDEAFARTGNAFPPLFHELLAVGEETGAVDQILLNQAEHYRHLRNLQRTFVHMSAWPMIQLVGAIVVVGVVIVVIGTVVPGKADILGFGMVGWEGLLKYVMGLVVVLIALAGVARFFTMPYNLRYLKGVCSVLPGFNSFLVADAMARFCRTMSMVDQAGMDLRRGIRASLLSTSNQRYIRTIDDVVAQVSRGDSLAQSLQRTGQFPAEVVAAVDVGEQSGKLSETLVRLSDQYRRQAETRSHVATMLLSFVIWGVVASLIIFLIFRIAGYIFGIYQDLAKPV